MRDASFWRNRLDQETIDKIDWMTVDGRGLRLGSAMPSEAWTAQFIDDLPSFGTRKLALKRIECGFLDDEQWSSSDSERCRSKTSTQRFNSEPPIQRDVAPDEEALRRLLGNRATCEILAIDIAGEQIFRRLDHDRKSDRVRPLSTIFGDVLLEDCGLTEPFDRAHESLRKRLKER